MTISESLKWLSDARNYGDADEDIEAREFIKGALEKGEPKEPYKWGDGYSEGEVVYDMYDCPNCGKSYELDFEEYDYCPNCGQCIDWEVRK